MVSAEGLGDKTRKAQRAPQGQGRCRSQARGHSAPHVDRRDRVQLGQEEGRRVARNKEVTGSRDGRDKAVPAGTVAVVRSSSYAIIPRAVSYRGYNCRIGADRYGELDC